jgi:hypothetical protein
MWVQHIDFGLYLPRSGETILEDVLIKKSILLFLYFTHRLSQRTMITQTPSANMKLFLMLLSFRLNRRALSPQEFTGGETQQLCKSVVSSPKRETILEDKRIHIGKTIPQPERLSGVWVFD